MKAIKIKLALLSIALLFGACLGVRNTTASPPAQGATMTITFNFASNGQRAAILEDFARAKSLDIFTDGTQTTVDPTKVQPAITALFKSEMRSAVLDYRGRNAGASAEATQRIADGTAVNP